jgi:hypothetical protein
MWRTTVVGRAAISYPGRVEAQGRRRIPGTLAALALCLGVVAGPAAAQTQEPMDVDVIRTHTPPTLPKLRANGVTVQATCNRDCLLVVTVKVSPAKAAKLGLSKRSIGSGARFSEADAVTTVRVRIRPKAMDALERSQGGRFKIGIQGRDCSAGCVL